MNNDNPYPTATPPTRRQTPKPVSEWGKSLGDYFASRRDIDIKKARQLAERHAIQKLRLYGFITPEEEKDALINSDDLAVALAELQALVAARQLAARRGGE